MNLIFFGSSEFSIPFLDTLKEKVALVVTSEDKVRGRGMKMLPNPVKDFATKNHLRYAEVERFGEPLINTISSLIPCIYLVVSFGKIIPSSILSMATCAINLHPSALPLYRGAAPLERQIMDGVEDSALCIIKVEEGIDTGDIILKKPFKIYENETRGDIEKRIFEEGVPLLMQAIDSILSGHCEGRKQEGTPSYAKKIRKEEELINWKMEDIKVHNIIRALSPRPCAHSTFREKEIKFFRSAVFHNFDEVFPPGVVIYVSKDSFAVKCGQGAVEILELQVAGGKVMAAKDFINGYKIKTDEVFI